MNATLDRPAQARPSLVGPVILIGVGSILLLNNLGLLSWGIWDTLLRLWPLALIAVGLDLAIGRRSAAAMLLIPLLLVAAFGIAIWWANSGVPVAGALETTVIRQPLEGATRAEVVLGMGVGELHLAAMDEAEGLIAGNVQASALAQLSPSFTIRDGVAFYTLRAQNNGSRTPWGGRSANERWDLRLNPTLPLRLTLDTGVGTTSADLTDLKITDLKVNSGVGSVNLTLPRQGQTQATINGGVGQISINIPEGVAARIELSRGLGDMHVQGTYTHNGNIYESPGYAQAAQRVSLKVNGGIGGVTIR